MMKLKPYPVYKDSGLPWLGAIPAHWDIKRLKYLLREMDARSQNGTEQLLSVSQYTGVTPRRSKSGTEEPDTRASSLVGYKQVAKEDLIVNIMLAWNGSMGVSRYSGVVSPAYCVYRFREGACPSYFHYLLRQPIYKGRIKAASTGVVESRLHLYTDDLFRIEGISPPPEEQLAIARLANHIDSDIDHLIRVKRRLIELLNEQKQAIIHHAVTRGFDPNVCLKPSGINWLGDVPKHWTIRRNGSLYYERIERGDPAWPVLIVSLRTGVTVGEEKDEDGRPRRLIADRTSYKKAVQGDIAYNMMRMWQGAVGVAPVDGLVSPAYVVAAPCAGVDTRFFVLLFRTKAYMAEVNQESRGIVSDRNRLYWEDFKRLPSPVPPYREQKQIVETLEVQLAEVDRVIDRLHREIDLVREYRTRLIADVVTGKLDVRGVQLPESITLPEWEREEVESESEVEGGEDLEMTDAEF